MTGTFGARMQALIDSAEGGGRWKARVVVDQVYAKYQELRDDIELHGGGKHHYTHDALYGHTGEIMELYSRHLLTPDGVDMRGAVEKIATVLVTGVYENAPFEFGDLKASGHGLGEHDGAVVYDRPPGAPRLTEDELRAKGHLRRLGLGNDLSTAEIHDALGNFG